MVKIIDNIIFSTDDYGYDGLLILENLENIPTKDERIEFAKKRKTNCEKDIKDFKNRMKNESERKKQEIETWIAERHDILNVLNHYLKSNRKKL